MKRERVVLGHELGRCLCEALKLPAREVTGIAIDAEVANGYDEKAF